MGSDDTFAASAFTILDRRLLAPPFLDGAPSCLVSLAPLASREIEVPVTHFEDLAARISRARGRDVPEILETLSADIDRSQGLVRACLHIENARLQLRLGFGPEALVELRRADRSTPAAEWLPSMRDTASYYRAEAGIRAGRDADLSEDFAALAGSAYRSLAAAARLRRAELSLRNSLDELDKDDAGNAWKELRELLEQGRQRSLAVHSWAPMAAEVAIRAGHHAEAHRWLAIAETQPGARDAAAIRKADVLVELAQIDDARRTLRRVLTVGRSKPARELAALRLARYGLVTGGSEERIELLERAAASQQPTVRLLAQELLARERLSLGEIEVALQLLREIAHTQQHEIVAQSYPLVVDRALEVALDGADCPQILGRLAASWQVFLPSASQDEVFARIGDCYLEMGMGADALAVFRGIIRRFGAEAVPDVAWRVARASLDAGDLPSARASLRAQLAAVGGNRLIRNEREARWQWLAARMARMEGRDEEAEKLWLALAGSKHLPPELRGGIELELIRAWRETEDDVFEAALRDSLAEPAWVDPGLRAQVRVQLADRSWDEGRRRQARTAYRDALALVDTPNARSRARYRGALVEGSNDAVREALRSSGNADPKAAWSRLARVELLMMDLRQAVGREAQVQP